MHRLAQAHGCATAPATTSRRVVMVIMPMPVMMPVRMIVIVTASRAVRVVVVRVVMVFVIVCMPMLLTVRMIVTTSCAVRVVVMHVVMVFVIVCMPMLLRMLARMPLGRFALRALISACMCAPTAMSTAMPTAMPTLLPVLQLIIAPISVRMAATVLVPMPCVPHIPVCMRTNMRRRMICMR